MGFLYDNVEEMGDYRIGNIHATLKLSKYMLRKENNGIHYLQFKIFSEFPKLKHAIFLRNGGFSSDQYDSLNLSYTVGDIKETVYENEKKVLSLLSLPKLVRGNLVHGKTVLRAEQVRFDRPCDAIVTNESNVGLMITHADCQAACFYDPVRHVIANVHSGWKSSVLNIYRETAFFMKENFGTNVKDLHVGVTPSLGPMHAEFLHYKEELPKSFWQYQVKPFYFDFWQISKQQLKECGIPEDQIEIASICTFSNSQDYFSYRRDKVTGRNATIIAL